MEPEKRGSATWFYCWIGPFCIASYIRSIAASILWVWACADATWCNVLNSRWFFLGALIDWHFFLAGVEMVLRRADKEAKRTHVKCGREQFQRNILYLQLTMVMLGWGSTISPFKIWWCYAIMQNHVVLVKGWAQKPTVLVCVFLNMIA